MIVSEEHPLERVWLSRAGGGWARRERGGVRSKCKLQIEKCKLQIVGQRDAISSICNWRFVICNVQLLLLLPYRRTIESGQPPNSEMKAKLLARKAALAAQWKEESPYLSNSAKMAMLKPYQRIIGMGPDVVPLILEELQREPDHWFWALESITQEDPVPPDARGKIDQMAEAWIVWGKQQGYIPA
jgi:hypothetical protein